MLNIKTVFVLGAGSSVPFGFPTGLQLSNKIYDQLSRSASLHSILREKLKYSEDSVDAFRRAFYYSGKNSIDAFLEHRIEFMDIGKAAIAASLIEFEVPEHIFNYKQDNWLRYTFSHLSTRFEEFDKNRLSIITFNYDRVAEWFLFTSLLNSYGKTSDECVAVLKSIPVIHLHGRLGYLPWEKPPGRGFENIVDEKSLSESIDHIKIIHEDTSDGRDADFDQAKQLLTDADQIYFLGFGFNRTNVERLGIAGLSPHKSGATALGLSSNEVAEAAAITGGKVTFYDLDCIGLCRDRIKWSRLMGD